MRQALLPVLRQELCLGRDLVDVVSKCKSYHVCAQSVDQGPGLLAGAAVRLLDDNLVTGLSFPLTDERGVEVLLELACRIAGDIEQFDFGRAGRPESGKGQRARDHRRISFLAMT